MERDFGQVAELLKKNIPDVIDWEPIPGNTGQLVDLLLVNNETAYITAEEDGNRWIVTLGRDVTRGTPEEIVEWVGKRINGKLPD